MSRPENRIVMGYFAFDEKHHPALLSLVQPATPAHKLLDPFAGEGAVLEAMAKGWQVTPYANELDEARAQACRQRFGVKHAIQGDAERLLASNNAFQMVWVNPPYDHDGSESGSKRLELKYLRHSWKWGAPNALMMWVVYHHHLTEDATTFLAKNSLKVDVWACPGKHLGEYDQIIVVAIKGTPEDPEALYDDILRQKNDPHLLEIQPEPVYKLPPAITGRQFMFTSTQIDAEQGLRLIEDTGAWRNNGFQALLETPPPPQKIKPIVAPRPGHTALVLAAGVANGAVIETADYGTVAIRGKTLHVENISHVDVEADPNDPDHQIKKTTLRLKPTTTLTLLSADGRIVEMDGDDALLQFITDNRKALAEYLNEQFSPTYTFDMNGLSGWLSRIRLKHKYELYTAQKHVIAAITKGFETHNGILLAGMMGVGKTALGSAVSISIASQLVHTLRDDIRPDQVTLLIAPPHLIDKWQRELLSISSNIYVEKLKRHEDVKAFMSKAQKLGAGVPKIGLIKRDMTKLGSGFESAVVWRNEYQVLWRHDQPVPAGYEERARLEKISVPKCPHCGTTITQERKGQTILASKTWLKNGKRSCAKCHTPLWQDVRDSASRPKAGEKYPRKNPRYRIDEYIKRRYKDRVYLLIWDEVHESQHSDTGNGLAFNRLANCAKKVLGLTGTPFNGRSSSLFNLEYSINPRTRQRFSWGGAPRFNRKERGTRFFQTILSDERKQRGRAEARWVEQMGVRERVIEERPQYDAVTGAYTGTSTYEKPYSEAPGISPLLVAEMIDHTVYFALKDLGKSLPDFEETAIPVAMDADVAVQHDNTRQRLKDYLIQRKWEGDNSFRGAYLQWSMSWVNAPFRDTEVIHNMRHPITNEIKPHTVAKIASYGEERIYAKEQALIDILREELAQDRPCIVYLRQTGTKDIQPRYERLIREHVEGAKPFILKNTVSAERREKVIETEVAKGMNVLITNPELVRTGLDLLFAPTIIFVEVIYNLSTLMQAAARSYRLNQTHKYCRVKYLYYEDTMEQTAVHLMSRKQRAAKLLTGDAGLTGLDSLTQGEGSFEQALLDAIAQEDALVDPTALFTSDAKVTAIDEEDMAFWNVNVADETPDIFMQSDSAPPNTITLEPVHAVTKVNDEDAVQEAILVDDAVVTQPRKETQSAPLHQTLSAYLADHHIIADSTKYAKLLAKLGSLIANGQQRDDDTYEVVGMGDKDYLLHRDTLIKHVARFMRKHSMVFMEQEKSIAGELVQRCEKALKIQITPANVVPFERATNRVAKKRKLDLSAMPDDDAVPAYQTSRRRNDSDDQPRQLAMF